MAKIQIHNIKTGKVVNVEAAVFTPHLQKQGWELVDNLKFQTTPQVAVEKKSVVVENEETQETEQVEAKVAKQRGRKPKQ
jgi:hypothetical protein